MVVYKPLIEICLMSFKVLNRREEQKNAKNALHVDRNINITQYLWNYLQRRQGTNKPYQMPV